MIPPNEWPGEGRFSDFNQDGLDWKTGLLLITISIIISIGFYVIVSPMR
jgi:hypothetical protein